MKVRQLEPNDIELVLEDMLEKKKSTCQGGETFGGIKVTKRMIQPNA